MSPQLAQVFLSHRSPDKPVVEGVGAALRQLGAQIWLDKEQLLAGQSIATELRKAIRSLKQVVLFVSEHELGAWVEDELSWAFELEDQRGPKVIVVLLGCAPEVMVGAPALHERMRHDDGVRWNRKFETLDIADLHDPVAHQRLARAVMKALLAGMRWSGKVTLCWAQRYESEDPQEMALRALPPEVTAADDPCLLLLPREGGRNRGALLNAAELAALRDDLDWLAGRLDHHCVQQITVAGAAQHALFAWVGVRWDRTSGALLRLPGRTATDPVLGGPPAGPARAPAAAAPVGDFLLVLRSETTPDAQRAAARAYGAAEGLQVVEIEHPPLLQTQDQLDALSTQVESAARAGGPRRAVLLCLGPTFVAAAAATRLTVHFAGRVEIAEYDARGGVYRTLPLRH
ncbi:MAG: toll/interleukin-1 receptor domain-containing protein [Deltaproteobacteria bacterium]|nr:toll/interleukin-1 receptor domain-containing protein [Deltaproteobacteria bacterium]